MFPQSRQSGLYVGIAVLLLLLFLPQTSFGASFTTKLATVWCQAITYVTGPLEICEDTETVQAKPQTYLTATPDGVEKYTDFGDFGSSAKPTVAGTSTAVVRETPLVQVFNSGVSDNELTRRLHNLIMYINLRDEITKGTNVFRLSANVSVSRNPDDIVTKQHLWDTLDRINTDTSSSGGGGDTVNNITNNYSTTTNATGDIFADTLTLGTTTSRAQLTLTEAIFLADFTPVTVANMLYNSGGDLYWNGSVLSASSTGNWAQSSGNVYRLTGNVGIGTTTPASALTVVGEVRADTVRAELLDMGGQVCNVEAYGAVGDNATINDEAIAAAIADCGPSGGTVLFPMGEFRISEPIVLDTPVTLMGSYASRWSYSSEPRSGIRADFGSFTGGALIHVRDRTISGETDHNNGGRLVNLSIDGGSTPGGAHGVHFEGLVRDWKLINVDIAQTTGNGFLAEVGAGGGNPRGFTINGLSIYSADGHGFRATALNDSYIEDLLAVGNALRGIYLSSMGETKINNSRAVFNALEGLYIDGASNNGGLMFTDFSTDRNDRHGVRVSSTGTTTVTFNGLLTRRDGANNGGGSETPYAGVAVIGTTTTKAAPVIINGLSQIIGVDDAGAPPLAPDVGVRVTNAEYVRVNGQLWGVTQAYVDGGGNGWFIIEDDSIVKTGTDWGNLTPPIYALKWVATTTGLYYASGTVSIGSQASSSRLFNITAESNAGARFTDTTNNVRFDMRAEDTQAFFGTFSNHDLRFQTNNTSRFTILSGGNVGVGTTSPSHLFTVAGNMNLTGALNASGNAGTAGMVLQTTGVGTQWVATSSLGISGASTFLSLTDTPASFAINGAIPFELSDALTFSANFTYDGNNLGLGGTNGIAFGGTRFITASTTNDSLTFGERAGAALLTTGTDNVLFGYESGQLLLDGQQNIGIGNLSLNNATTADRNIAIGQETLQALTSGGNNVAIGHRAGEALTSGGQNVAIGSFAMFNSTSSDFNTALGYSSLGALLAGTYNSAFGHNSAESILTGARNVFMGFAAGQGATSTSDSVIIGAQAAAGIGATNLSWLNNTIIGYRAGYTINGASNNVLLGYRAGDTLTTGNNNVVIGYDIETASTTASNQLNIGNLIFGTGVDGTGTTLSSGNIGIGTVLPVGRLAVSNANLSQSWSQVGSGLSIASVDGPTLATLSPNRVAYIDDTNDSLRVYEWNGSTWSQLGSGLSIGGTNGPVLTSISPNRVAFIESTNDNLVVYEWNGSTWSQVGSGLNISGNSNPSLTTLSPTRVAFIDSSNDSLRVYEWNGSTWSQVGNSLAITNTTGPSLVALSANQIAYIDDTNDSLSTYQYSNPTFFTGNSNGYSFLSVSDAGYTSIESLLVNAGLTVSAGASGANATNGASSSALFVNGTSILGDDLFARRNVAIGTTSVSNRLTVDGTLLVSGTSSLSAFSLSGAYRDTSNSAGSLGMVLQTTGTSTRWVATSTLGLGGTSVAFGTDNQIPFTNAGGTNYDYSSNFVFDGTSLAIGTTTPRDTLDVWGGLRVGTNSPVLTASSTTGRVGIGTMFPEYQFQVGDGTATGGQWMRNFGSTTDILIGQSANSHFGFGAGTAAFIMQDVYRNFPLVIGNLNPQPLIFGTNSSERMRIHASGNVSIGTANDLNVDLGVNGNGIFAGTLGIDTSVSANKLDIGDGTQTGDNWLRLFGDVSEIYIGQSDIALMGLASSTTAFVVHNSGRNSDLAIGNIANRALIFGTNDTERMRISATGDVGIGTTTTGNYVLTVGGAGSIGATTLNLLGDTTTSYLTPTGVSIPTKINIPNFAPGAFGQIIAMGLPASAPATARAISMADARTVPHQPTLAVFSPDESNLIGFSWDGSNTTSYLKTTGGGIGIRSNTTDLLTFLGTGEATFSNSVSIATSTQNHTFTVDGTGTMRVGANGANSFLVNGNGTVSIGTTSDIYNLNVDGFGTMRVGASGASSLVVALGGNVGIGTSTPTSRLTVSGDINMTGALLFNGQQLLKQETGTNEELELGLGASANGFHATAIGLNAFAGSHSVAVGADSTTNNFDYTNVLGRLSQTFKPNTNAIGSLLYNYSAFAASNTTYIGSAVVSNAIEEGHSLVLLGQNSGSYEQTPVFGIETDWINGAFNSRRSQAEFNVYDATSSRTFLSVSTDGANPVLIFNPDGGNVGIGTSTPSSKLTVVGVIETTGGIRFADGTLQTTAATSSSGSGGSSMVSGWPDSILCTSSTYGERPLYLANGPFNGDGHYYYSNGPNIIEYDASGVFVSQTALGSLDNCFTDIATLYSEGRAFNFVGGGGNLWTASSSDIFFGGDNVGIGTSSPAYKLTVSHNVDSSTTPGIFLENTSTGGSAATMLTLRNDDGAEGGIFLSGSNNSGIGLANQTAFSGSEGVVIMTNGGVANGGTDTFSVRVGGFAEDNVRLTITSTGNVGIGTTTPSAQLTTTGTVRFASLGSAGANLITDTDGNVTVSSDERLKDIQDTFDSGLSAILGIEPIKYKWNATSGMETQNVYTGFSAQNILASIPEAVAEDSRGYLTLSDRPILAAVVNAIKELFAMVTGIETKVEILEEQNEELKARIEALEAEQGIVPPEPESTPEPEPEPAPTLEEEPEPEVEPMPEPEPEEIVPEPEPEALEPAPEPTPELEPEV